VNLTKRNCTVGEIVMARSTLESLQGKTVPAGTCGMVQLLHKNKTRGLIFNKIQYRRAVQVKWQGISTPQMHSFAQNILIQKH
jgi:hypothetical protein